jgi:AcrR family transcriptional regulator
MTEPIGRTYRGRRSETTVRNLMLAVVEDLTHLSYAEVSARTIAKRADVSPATFYTYFSSKDHLLAAVFRDRMLTAAAGITLTAKDPAQRLEDGLAALIGSVFADAGLTKAWTTAMLADDPDITKLRDDAATKLAELIVEALGATTSPVVLRTVMLSLSGALLAAGQGIVPFEQIPAMISEGATLMLARPRRS